MAQLDALPRELAHWTAASTSQYTHTHTQYTPTSTSHSHSQYAPPPHHGGHNHTPMTPPHTDAVEPRRLAPGWGVAQTHLQTQSYTGGAGHRGQLLTPPDDTPPLSEPQSNGYYVPPPQSSSALTSTSTSSTATLPSSSTTTSSSSSTAVPAPAAPTEETEEPLAWAASWLPLSGRGRESAALVAEKTCEMICYLWFAPSVPGATASSTASNSNSTSSGGASSGEGNKDGKENGGGRTTPSPLQLAASPTFVSFTQKLLETTQVSQSVIILALHYIHRLRLRNLATPAQPGSEFRVAVAGLMMGNKYLDDNTYTNATWAAVSLIPLAQINTMEREFLVGCDYSLFVSQKTYEDWGRLLKGLVGARARAAGR
ncbi:hypothetical protein B0H16DRAFT_1026033 [Mycena metata]|uniref:Cyclin-domain-containing protein n=1 Tax=Mycena metata TaxID=1033252 RepID=A0AAD7IHY3_9AGAR|nr:hypothetical protein B0H16DRAFT_1026033 [Mycena metata]